MSPFVRRWKHARPSSAALQGTASDGVVGKLNLQDNTDDVDRVQAFLNEVVALPRAGVLTQARADSLSGPGSVLLAGLRRR